VNKFRIDSNQQHRDANLKAMCSSWPQPAGIKYSNNGMEDTTDADFVFERKHTVQSDNNYKRWDESLEARNHMRTCTNQVNAG